MSTDIIIFSRGRDQELQRTISRLISSGFRVLVFHNSGTPLKFDCESANIEYFFCPGKSYGERAKEAKKHLRNPFTLICSDDDGIVECELKTMEEFLISHPDYASVGGEVLGAFPYGSFVSGTFAYTEMTGYLSTDNHVKSRIERHMLGSQMGKLPRAAMYRLFRKEKMGILLDALSTCTEVKTPYIFEVVSEFMSAWLGPTAYIPSIYWIRNWKNKMVEHTSWDRRFEFYDWWNHKDCEIERNKVLGGLSEITQLDSEFITKVFSNYASIRNEIFAREAKVTKSSKRFARKFKHYLFERFFPNKIPSKISDTILVRYPAITRKRLREISRVAEEMF